jgi:hypothetical protein
MNNSCKSLRTNKRKAPDSADEVLNLVALKLQSQEEHNKCSTFGKHIAEELSAQPEEMLKYCKKIINDAIFEAQMGTLNRTSRIVTDAVHPPHQTFRHFRN